MLIRKVLKLSHFSNKIPRGKQTKQSKPKIKKDFLAKLENENASNIWAIRFVSVRAQFNKVYFEYISQEFINLLAKWTNQSRS